VQNRTKGNTMGELVPVFKMATSENVKTGYLKHFRLDYCFGIGKNLTPQAWNLKTTSIFPFFPTKIATERKDSKAQTLFLN